MTQTTRSGKPAGKKAAAPRQRKPASRLTILVLAALLMALGVQIFRMTGQIREARAEEAVYAQRLEELQAANQKLKDDLDNSTNLDLIEDFARDQLGMVSPGEKILHFSK